MNAGIDFESKILVKHDAARLLRDELCRPNWQCEPISISGVTDCYQPAERRFRITRSLLEVLLEARQPCGIVTKNGLVLRDLDLVAEMARRRLIHVFLSVTTLDRDLARRLEPRTSTPEARLAAIARLTEAGVPVGVMVAPLIPGLNDEEIPAILTAAREAGAATASYVMLRLPLAVEPIFRDWLAKTLPLKQERIEGLIRSTRAGEMSDDRFGSRMRGTGEYAEQIATTFRVFKERLGLGASLPPYDLTSFRPPRDAAGQRTLF
ncbi:MAG: radical SAM protein [Planctomycetota bacterium]|nr:MAG: radical SAM protein [Planctomycetota bacterium]REJ89959.1 MAG: radical SAM protein [Planctomycetota bacterium]REK28191.1 MAG: radical SAM protein [Planctomycetota bacterium]REK42449.1 MAG: radical SAM protein [Planctomycetota bacterium]